MALVVFICVKGIFTIHLKRRWTSGLEAANTVCQKKRHKRETIYGIYERLKGREFLIKWYTCKFHQAESTMKVVHSNNLYCGKRSRKEV